MTSILPVPRVSPRAGGPVGPRIGRWSCATSIRPAPRTGDPRVAPRGTHRVRAVVRHPRGRPGRRVPAAPHRRSGAPRRARCRPRPSATIGAKSGQPRENPRRSTSTTARTWCWWPPASAATSTRRWYHNLVAHPDVTAERPAVPGRRRSPTRRSTSGSSPWPCGSTPGTPTTATHRRDRPADPRSPPRPPLTRRFFTADPSLLHRRPVRPGEPRAPGTPWRWPAASVG